MKNIKIILVNLISPYYLVRYQAPMAVNLLAAYIKSKDKSLRVDIIDMQEIYDENMDKGNRAECSFRNSLNQVKEKISRYCRDSRCVIGFSMKFKTVGVTEEIMKCFAGNKDIIFVLGNIGSTFSYQRLLKKPLFDKSIAVIGEGEEALYDIVDTARKNMDNISDTSLYRDIPNVATNSQRGVTLECFKRVDLEKYPQIYLKPAQIYDKEWKVHAIETSRGCPWGRCTFCSINGQFGGSLIGMKSDVSWKGFPLDTILKKIKRLVAEGVRVIDVKDSEFFGPMDTDERFYESINRVRDFANEMIKINDELDSKKPGDRLIIKHISIRVDTIYREKDDEKNIIRKNTYELLKKAGLKGVYIGIESGSKTQLRRYCKGATVNENKKALEILKELDLEIEPGFIFFDYLADVSELHDNILFLEDTKMYRLDSRILGSLRVQQGSTYVLMVKNAGLLGEEDEESLGFSCRYRDLCVEEIENVYSSGEESTVDLMKLLTREERLPYYELNFKFLKNLVSAYYYGNPYLIPEIIDEFCGSRNILHNYTLDKISSGHIKRQEAYIHVNNAILENKKYDLTMKELIMKRSLTVKHVSVSYNIKGTSNKVLIIEEV